MALNIVKANLSKAISFSQIIVHSRKRQSKPSEVGNQSLKIRIVILVNTKLMPKIKLKCSIGLYLEGLFFVILR